MKEIIIFLVIFLIVFSSALIIFNGRFIYAQLKYSFLGAPPIHLDIKKWGIFSKLPSFFDRNDSLRLVIPLIGVDAPIVLTNTTNNNIIQKDLENGVVKYPDANVILGHSSAYPWYKGSYGSVFSLLNKLGIGDEILIFSNDEKYSFKVLEKQINLPKNLEFQDSKNDSIIYLVSCWPINTNWKRIVVRAERVDKK